MLSKMISKTIYQTFIETCIIEGGSRRAGRLGPVFYFVDLFLCYFHFDFIFIFIYVYFILFIFLFILILMIVIFYLFILFI